MKTILIVDDEQAIRESVRMILEYERYGVETAENGEIALRKLETSRVDAILLDVKMPGLDGMEVLHRIRARGPEPPVIMISGHGTIETAVDATKLGAFDFLPKPLDRDKLLVTLRNALQHARLSAEVVKLQSSFEEGRKILGDGPKIKELLALIERVAPSDARVLITGENGTGKELVARAIHRQSKRVAGPFVEVNCAAIPGELIESELFGHEKGSFSGAAGQRVGKFEQADGGTLFLDEIGDMSPQAQAKVLRALEGGKIERVGGNKLIPVDVRVLAATNKDLEKEIAAGSFRSDLFHRLQVIPIHVVPLRERREDIPLLTKAFVAEICFRMGIAPKRVSEPALASLAAREWPGNVRELRNTVERLVILAAGESIDDQIPTTIRSPQDPVLGELLNTAMTFQEFKDRAEAAFIRKQLEVCDWNVSKTAEALDIQRSHLYTKMKRYGLVKGDEENEE